jgi:hypothetical protein
MNRLLQKFVDWGKFDYPSMMQKLEEEKKPCEGYIYSHYVIFIV